MKAMNSTILALLLAPGSMLQAQEEPQGEPAATSTFDEAAAKVRTQLEQSITELNELRERMAGEKIPLTRELNRIESELLQVQEEYQQVSRQLTKQTLDLTNLRTEIKSRQEETSYLSGLIGDYIRNFETTLHVTEDARYADVLARAKLAPDNGNLTAEEIFQVQSELLEVSVDRLFDLLGGTRFEGNALDSDSLVKKGTFVLVGPAALFASEDGAEVGSAEMRLNSSEPAAIHYGNLEDQQAAAQLVRSGAGFFPLDPTLGDAHKMEATEETFVEHVKKGGPVMIPIFGMAALALLIALFKWLGMLFLRKPPRRKVAALMHAVAEGDEEVALSTARALKGPTGRMLAAGAEHLREPRELIEEIMYETLLTTRLRLQRFLPFIAICAASAPLLGLLGTVTGIINTFKMITVYGSGDVKSLSGGISEALITTKFGLIVAIPSLLLHAFLSRKARGVTGSMEQAAVAFVNQVSCSPFAHREAVLDPAQMHLQGSADSTAVRGQVREVLSSMLGSVDDRESRGATAPGEERKATASVGGE